MNTALSTAIHSLEVAQKSLETGRKRKGSGASIISKLSVELGCHRVPVGGRSNGRCFELLFAVPSSWASGTPSLGTPGSDNEMQRWRHPLA